MLGWEGREEARQDAAEPDVDGQGGEAQGVIGEEAAFPEPPVEEDLQGWVGAGEWTRREVRAERGEDEAFPEPPKEEDLPGWHGVVGKRKAEGQPKGSKRARFRFS